MFTEDQKTEILEYLKETPGDVFIGGDSQTYSRKNKLYARFTVVLIVHIDNSKGGKIFHFNEIEEIYGDITKPKVRLMTEVSKIVNTYLDFQDELIDRYVEIHLDLNPNKEHKSNKCVKEAIGYVQGVTGIEAKIKPEAFAAANVGDHYVRGKNKK